MSSLLTFAPRFKLSDLFTVKPDLTAWNGQYDAVPRPRVGRSLVRTPARGLASFISYTRGLELVPGKQLPHWHGVYVIGFRDPYPAVYVGIAADDKAKPEGILKRLQKHRVKVTGSHVHEAKNLGGILHPKRWGDFAASRHADFASRGKVDLLEDVVIMTGSLGEGDNAKDVLQSFEQHLSLPQNFKEASSLCLQLVQAVFDHRPAEVYSLNTQRSRKAPLDGASVSFDGQPPMRLESR